MYNVEVVLAGIHWLDASQLKAPLFSGFAPRDRFSRGAIALLPGDELQDSGFALLPDLLHGG